MNPNDPEKLRQSLWRKPLPASEINRVKETGAIDAQVAEDLALEAALTRALSMEPKAEVPSNFTALLMQELDREPAHHRQPRTFASRLSRRIMALVPRFAVAAVAVAIVGLAYHEHTLSRRAEMARSLSAFSAVASLPSVEVLEDFDTIQRLRQSPPSVDLELLAALQ